MNGSLDETWAEYCLRDLLSPAGDRPVGADHLLYNIVCLFVPVAHLSLSILAEACSHELADTSSPEVQL